MRWILKGIGCDGPPIYDWKLLMAIAPDPILKAALSTIHRAMVYCRLWTYDDSVPREQINSLMDALHEVPMMVAKWEHHDVDDIRIHLRCFKKNRCKNAPDLVAHFDMSLAEFGHESES